jgi:GntR family transcriptional regulator
VTINRESPIALYRQIADDLAGALTARYRVGQRLPSESELMSTYGVSRITVRQALGHLTARGLLVRQQGKGTFVAAPRVRQDLRQLTGFVDVLTAQGLSPATTLLTFGPQSAPAMVGERLQLDGADVLTFRRLYRLDDRPLALTEVHYPPAVGIMIEREAAEQHSSQVLLTEHAGITIGHADLTIRAAPLDTDLAQPLGLTSGATALIEERLTYCTAGLPREHSTLYLHPEFCELHLTVQPGQSLAHAVRPVARPPGNN